MASWLPHNKFVVAAEPVPAVNKNVADKLRRYIKPGRVLSPTMRFRSVGSHGIVLHGTRLVPDEKNVGHKVRRYGAAGLVQSAFSDQE